MGLDKKFADGAKTHAARLPEDLAYLSGAGVDRLIERKRPKWIKPALLAGVAASLFLLAVWIFNASSGRVIRVANTQITLSKVSEGIFEDFIPLRARVTPLKTIFLDAIEGGRVENVYVEDGALLEAGSPIVKLSNTALQLDVTRNEALVTEQLNQLHTIELNFEQNRLTHKRNLVEIDYQIIKLQRQVERERELIKSNSISQAQLDRTEDELSYYIKRREVTLESQETDARLQAAQIDFLQRAGQQLEAGLALSRGNLDALFVKAPVAGRLSGFNVEVGQSINRGERIGQVSDPATYKLTALIDEFYLGRVDLGQNAHLEHDGHSYIMTIAKIYPQVVNGQFEVDLTFKETQPDTIRRGQTLQLKLTLSDESRAILIPNGAFYQDTGGNWVFVVNPAQQNAIKRPVRLGRRNANFIEVIDGLEKGEEIITSPYTGFVDMERIIFSAK